MHGLSRRRFAKLAVALACLAGAGGMRRPQISNASRADTRFARSFDGTPIAYETHGSGRPALVFVHGWSCDRSYWRNQLHHFAAANRVMAMDLAGHGESGRDRSAWTIESFGRDVAAVVHRVDAMPVVLIGHSMGGDVVVEAARLLGERAIGLVWVDTYRQLGQPRTAEQVEAMIAPLRDDFANGVRSLVRGMFAPEADPALVERVAADMASAPPSIALAAVRESLTYGRTITEAIAAIEAPIIAINPEHPPTDIASMERYGVEVVGIPEVGHFPMLESPDRFNAALREVIDSRFMGR